MFFSLDFRAQNYPLIFFIYKPFEHQQTLHFVLLDCEKYIYRTSAKFCEDLIYFQHFMQIFVFVPNW